MDLTPTPQDDQFLSEVLPEGTRLLNGQYVIERYLSSGGFGITYYARDSLDRRVVIKECFPEAYCSRKNRTVLARSQSYHGEFKSIVEMFVREAHSIAKLNHPNIVGVHQVFQDNETAYMALDLIDGKDLLDIIEASEERPSFQDVNAILLKLLDAISTVHDQDMLHRDISPDNILIDAWDNPVLIDFGAAREEASKKSRALSAVLVVKDGYSPQEFYIAGSQQTPCSDLYAIAATFFHLISGEAPPNSQSRVAAIASHKEDPYRPLAGRIKNYPRAFLEAIDTAMNVFPQDRIQNARDWVLRIDEHKRNEVALAHAKNDQEIEKTVLSLIQSAQREAELVASPPEPTVDQPDTEIADTDPLPAVVDEKEPVDSRKVLQEEQVTQRPPATPEPPKKERPKLFGKKEAVSDWVEKCNQKTGVPKEFLPRQSAVGRLSTGWRWEGIAVWFLFGVSLAALFLSNFAGQIAHFLGPSVL